jgi:gamma-glutamyltranspeptidase/glutathione hydrolase
MVSTQHYLATEAGVEILERGGNAIDAAVACAFALGVCEPAGSGLGGQTMMLIHLGHTRRTFALDGSSRAPRRTSLDELPKKQRRRGHRATTVPSTPAVLGYALERYGTLSLSRVMAPAVRLAENGYPITELQRRLIRRIKKYLREGPAGELFLKDGHSAFKKGQVFAQPVLARTLRRLARKGIADFYTGHIAQAICRDMAAHGGWIDAEDLAKVPIPVERRPVRCGFDDMQVVTFPPPGAGRTLIELLNIVRHFPPKLRSVETPEGAVLLAKAIRQAGRDRTDRPHDPDSYARVAIKRMLSVDYAKGIAHTCLRQLGDKGETTHLSVMDKYGNVVALTQSIERIYGACVASAELGFLYNSYMLAFEDEDSTHPYYLRPGAVPWASVAPTIVMRAGKPWLAIGSPGSERIVSAVAQVLLRLKRQQPFEAVSAPRLHCSLDGTVSLEASHIRSDIPAALERHGFHVDAREPHSFYLGCVQLAMREPDGFIGVADPRRDGSAGGPI